MNIARCLKNGYRTGSIIGNLVINPDISEDKTNNDLNSVIEPTIIGIEDNKNSPIWREAAFLSFAGAIYTGLTKELIKGVISRRYPLKAD